MTSVHPSRIAVLVAMLFFLGVAGCVSSNMTPADYNRMYQSQWGNFR
jgi:hypothetical protein